LLTRSGLDWTDKFPTLAALCGTLPVDPATLAGELVGRAGAGATSFQQLQQQLETGQDRQLELVLFDLLELDGTRWASRPLRDRRAALTGVLGRRRGRIRLSRLLRGSPATLLTASCRDGHEGVISKRLAARYRSGRGRDWLKTKCGHRQEFVVLGFTPPGGSRTGLGSLLLGVHDADGWRYAGRVGSGFSDTTLGELTRTLQGLKRARSALGSHPADVPAKAQWVKPQLVVEVKFTEWTGAGRLRHPVFIAMRSDKKAAEIRRELPVHTGRAVRGDPQS
jgi:bifunctional non-homologous end joining protein LigD